MCREAAAKPNCELSNALATWVIMKSQVGEPRISLEPRRA
jgi:hypothetical protein